MTGEWRKVSGEGHSCFYTRVVTSPTQHCADVTPPLPPSPPPLFLSLYPFLYHFFQCNYIHFLLLLMKSNYLTFYTPNLSKQFHLAALPILDQLHHYYSHDKPVNISLLSLSLLFFLPAEYTSVFSTSSHQVPPLWFTFGGFLGNNI